MTLTRLERVKSTAMNVAKGNMPVTCLSGCIHALADEIEEIKKKVEEKDEPGVR